ncbi:dTMP kinase [Psychromonas sp. Urea-02u-13]|uniref:dTMP kinase n=1 Tax=Psychromonas sp. Urea-02u-13 TaxID=2058326 RepID=UPI000C326128|nr:dTMP kinase [Psychromonas sp. Urea-02u-13]PKG38689.1 dTMP kinase [Psychromonas sp. Urea-02u-13]
MSASEKLAGKFIVIEGLEGAGKSTAIAYIGKWLALQNMPAENITYTREPGGTELAERMRDIVKMDIKGEELEDKAELLLMYAARVQLVEHVIKPALRNNHIVVGDRHNWSSLAYQGGGRGINSQLIEDIKQVSLGNFNADFTLYLDIDPELGLSRARERGELDRIERLAIDFFERTRQVFLQLVKGNKSAVTIDASQTPELVEKAIFIQLDNWLASL